MTKILIYVKKDRNIELQKSLFKYDEFILVFELF